MNAKKAVAVVGTGPGLGAALAESFARAGHPVAIGARSLARLESLASEINSRLPSPLIKAFAVDATDAKSVRQFIKQAASAWPNTALHVGVWNPNLGFGIRPFQEWTEKHMDDAYRCQVIGAHAFTQQFLDENAAAGSSERHKATLLFTGATAALKGSSSFAGFAAAKAALRMLIESLAREKGPQGVHACHIIVDGIIDTEAVKSFAGEPKQPDERINAHDLAQQYLQIHQQPLSVWTNEVTFRPYSEKW